MESVRGVSKETRGIVLRWQEDATSAKERGINGRSAHIWVEVVIIVGTRVIGRRIVLVGLPRETKVRGWNDEVGPEAVCGGDTNRSDDVTV